MNLLNSDNIKLYGQWLNNVELIFEMLKIMRGREVSFISATSDNKRAIRLLKIHNMQFWNFKKNFYGLGITFFPNIYYSIASYQDLPFIPDNVQNRLELQKNFNASYNQFVTGYDFYLDFDNLGDFKKLKSEVKKTSDYLMEKGAIISIRISGSGFHIVVPSDFFKFIPLNERINFYRFYAQKLEKKLNLKTLDWKIINERGLLKIPYSLDFNTGNLCLPIFRSQILRIFENFSNYSNLANVNFRNRGIIWEGSANDLFFRNEYKKFLEVSQDETNH